MKKTIAAFLAIMLMCAALNLTTLASNADATRFSVISVNAEPGENVTIEVSIKNNPGIISACINVSFDSGLTLINAENGDVFPPSIAFTKPKQLSNGSPISGNCNFAWSGTDINIGDIKDGLMLTMTFAVSDIAKTGDCYNISVNTRKGDIVDRDLSVIDIGSANGKVTVSGESAVTGDKRAGASLKSLFDWFKKIIAIIKAVFSNIGNY